MCHCVAECASVCLSVAVERPILRFWYKDGFPTLRSDSWTPGDAFGKDLGAFRGSVCSPPPVCLVSVWVVPEKCSAYFVRSAHNKSEYRNNEEHSSCPAKKTVKTHRDDLPSEIEHTRPH